MPTHYPMADSNFSLPDEDELDQEIHLEGALANNKRLAVRYQRHDIKAVIKIHSFLFPRLFPVKLHDISSRGAAIFSKHKLSTKNRVTLYLLFSDGKRFEIASSIVHCESEEHRYGIKFDEHNHPLADHLLLTQTDLHFS